MNELQYLHSLCDHRIVDDLLMSFVEQVELTAKDFYVVAPKFGSVRYGTVRYGKATRYRRSLLFAPGATYREEADHSVTATADLDRPCTLNGVRIFKRGPEDADRVEIPAVEYAIVGGASAITDATYGSGHIYGTDYYGRTTEMEGGSVAMRTFKRNWELLDEDTVRIYRYDPKNEYYADYTVRQERCPKCLGSGVVDDLAFDKLARVVVLRHEQKVVQELTLAILRQIGSNPYYPNYGTTIAGLIGTNPAFVDVEGRVKEQVLRQITRLRQRQARRMNADPATVSPREIITSVDGIIVESPEPDRLQVTVSIGLLSGNKATVSAEFGGG